jgi:hypothetical protein
MFPPLQVMALRQMVFRHKRMEQQHPPGRTLWAAPKME